MSYEHMNNTQQQLQALDQRIATRMQALAATHEWWPCHRGCDRCCRQLARPLELTAAEWSRLDEAIATLPATIQTEITGKIRILLRQIAEGTLPQSVVCPYLNEQEGICQVYESRPIACRTYGFFVSRHDNQYCQIIETEVNSRGDANITWGYVESIQQELQQISGDVIPFDVH